MRVLTALDDATLSEELTEDVGKSMDCLHSASAEPNGVALITCIDDGMASSLVSSLPLNLCEKIYLLKPDCDFEALLCLSRYKAAIIVGATMNGTTPGTVSILNGSHLLKHSGPPTRVIFLGVESEPTEVGVAATNNLQLKLPNLLNNLSFLITKVIETLERDST